MKALTIVILLISTAIINGQNWTGKYVRTGNEGDGDLVISKAQKSHQFKFRIWVAGAVKGTCIGNFNGVATWETAGLAEFNRDFNETLAGEAIGCRITFIFTKGAKTVVIREHECNDFHGAGCGFEGTFKKIIKKRKTGKK